MGGPRSGSSDGTLNSERSREKHIKKYAKKGKRVLWEKQKKTALQGWREQKEQIGDVAWILPVRGRDGRGAWAGTKPPQNQETFWWKENVLAREKEGRGGATLKDKGCSKKGKKNGALILSVQRQRNDGIGRQRHRNIVENKWFVKTGNKGKVSKGRGKGGSLALSRPGERLGEV